jgi:putative colanic acid biosysnthesis UDP-glucose lipid carrier transferase
VAAVFDSVSSSVAGADKGKRVRFGNVEPAILALLKQLDPFVAALTLLAIFVVSGEPLTLEVFGLSLLTLLVSAPVFSFFTRDAGVLHENWFSKTASRIVLTWAAIIALLILLAFGFNLIENFSHSVVLTWFATVPLALFGVDALRHRIQTIIANGATRSRYLIIGVNRVGFELSRRLPQNGFRGFFDFRHVDRLAREMGTQLTPQSRLIGHCRDVGRFVRSEGITAIYIALPMSNVPRIAEVIQELHDTTASIYFVPDVFAFDLIQGKFVDIDGIPALSVCDTPFHGMDAVLKRAFDLVIGGLMLLLALPIMAILAIAVKLTSKGPILFQQRRYGLNGEEIYIYKFRSMTVCEDGSSVTQATRNDRRVTPLGRILRSTSLDELPQLLNVLQGKMSVVGPRPHAIAHNEQYRKLISGYMIRHKVRPGITGWAQVHGLRGETDRIEKMSERVRYDIDYLKNWSLALDCKILLRTAAMLLRRDERAY